MFTSGWKPLVIYKRAGLAEVIIHGSVAWCHGQEVIHQAGEVGPLFFRSLAKPFQMKACADVLDQPLSLAQKALTIASHNAEPSQLPILKSLLLPSEHSLLKTPASMPLMNFAKPPTHPDPWYHPCSGKHAGIIKASYYRSWDRAGYQLPQHPFHQAFLAYLRSILGPCWHPQVTAKDGCGLPTVSLTLSEMAQLFAALVRERERDWIWPAMCSYPDLIGGFGRLDSTILKSCYGRIIAKEGADGLLGLAIIHPDYPNGLGIALKIAHGWDAQAAWYCARCILAVLGFTLRNPHPQERQLAEVSPEVVAPAYSEQMEAIALRDQWHPIDDRWQYPVDAYC